MNSSGVWYRQRTKQLPTPVVLTDSFIEQKKTQTNSPNEQSKIETPTKNGIITTGPIINETASGGESYSEKTVSPFQIYSNDNFNTTKNMSLKSLNTPVTLRSVPYKRYLKTSQTKPSNLSKNGI